MVMGCYYAKISSKSIQCKSDAHLNRSRVVYITDYAKILGLGDYHPPDGFPQIRPDTLEIRSAAQHEIKTISAMAKDGEISDREAGVRIIAIKRRPDVMMADAAWACKDPALLVIFTNPTDSGVVCTIRRLRHYGTRNADGTYPILGLSCGRAADKLGLHVGDLIGVEIVGFAWEGWQDEMCYLSPDYDGKPLWEWKSNASPDFFAGRVGFDGYPIPRPNVIDTENSRLEVESRRVRDSKRNYDPDHPDVLNTEDARFMIYYKQIHRFKTEATRPSLIVDMTECARLLGLADYHPPSGFPQMHSDTLEIRSAAQREINAIRIMADHGKISKRKAGAKILAIKRRPDVMMADAAWACKDPALLVAFHNPMNFRVVYTIRRLHCINAAWPPSTLGLSCGRVADKLGLQVGDYIGVEILGFAWEGWQDEMYYLSPDYDGKPLWEWKSNASPDFFAGRVGFDGYPIPRPNVFDTRLNQMFAQSHSNRVRDSKRNYDPDCPDTDDDQ